jgi:hypothetical protein
MNTLILAIEPGIWWNNSSGSEIIHITSWALCSYFEIFDFFLPLDSPVVGKSYLQVMNLDLPEAWFLNRSDIKWWVGINSSGWGLTWVKSAELSWVVFAPKFGSVFLDFFQSVVLGFEWSLLCFDWLFFFVEIKKSGAVSNEPLSGKPRDKKSRFNNDYQFQHKWLMQEPLRSTKAI